MFFRKMFIAGIILASCLGVLASPVDIAEYSLRSGPSTTPLVTPTSDVSGLERRVDELGSISVSFVIIPKSDTWFAKLSSLQTSQEALYVLILKGRVSFTKEGDKVFYKSLPRAAIHQITNSGINLHIMIPENPGEIANILERVTRGADGCTWLIKAVDFLTQVAQTKGSEVGLSEAEAENAINLIMSKERMLGISSNCSRN